MTTEPEPPQSPFTFTASKDGKVFIRWGGRPIQTLKDAQARKFLAAAASADPDALQLLLARVTGNFKRGTKPKGRG